jgi:hypothetical protein
VSGLSDTAAQSPAGAKAVLARLVNDNPLNSALAQAHGTGPAAALAGKVKALDATTKAINQIAPGGPVGEAAGHVNGNAAAHMFAAAATHNPHAATSNGIRLAIDAIGLGTNRLSPAAADQMASALLTRDPVKQQQVINLLRAKGASEKNLAILRAYTGAAAGAVVPKAVIGQ